MNAFSDSAYRREFLVHATDAVDGSALAGAKASLTIADDQSTFYFGDATADTQGSLRLSYPPQHAVWFSLLVRAPSHVPVTLSGSKTNSGADFPGELSARLERGALIGGVVKDSAGKPVPGAQVLVFKIEKTGPREYTRMDYGAAKTGPDGKWSSTVVPANFTGFGFEVTQPEYRPTTYAQGPATSAQSLQVSRADLLAAKAEFVLQPAIRTQGIVADDSGSPIPGANIRLTDPDQLTVLQTFTSDGQGRFSFIAKEPGEANFMTQAKGFSPKFQSVFIQPETKIFTLGLSKVIPFKGRVVDQNAQPVVGALVRLDRWSGGPSLQWQTNTDTDGRFTWDSPPEGTITFFLSATNYSTMRMSFSGSFGEHTFNLRRISRVFGRVLDAETRKPVEDFTVIRGHAYNPGEPMRWQRYNVSRGKNGDYSMRLDDYSSGRNQIMIEAPGYLPAVSPPLTAAGVYTNDFELRKGKGIAGTVQLPDGTPVPNATVVLVDSSDSAYMDRPGELRRTGSSGDFQHSDRRGRFEFAPKFEAHTLIAAHDKGYAEVRASNILATGILV
ncbi:MAG TPA: carboxypeptidase-like regulatory domain-containing protein, partial [Verrucomicrobiae bacterium]